ncbi:MAG: aminotransferase class III-fold pyridoxal phosphate-dependent enzyme [Sneathiellaceae bacterium]
MDQQSPAADPMHGQPWPFVPFGANLTVDRAEGPYLYTPQGQRILDAAGGAVVGNIGYGRAEVSEAIATAVQRFGYVVPPFQTETRLALVERLQRHWLPPGLTRVHLNSGGSEAMEVALKLARQYHVARGEPQRQIVIGRDLSYHGATVMTLAVGGHAERRAGFEDWLPDWPKAPPHYCLRCPLGLSRPTCGTACVDAVERLILDTGPDRVAAFIAEPVVGASGGAFVPPDDYWPRLREICSRHGVLLIADEVMSGFGRTGAKFAVDHWGCVPDILVGGKGMSGGYAPIAGVYASAALAAPLAATGQQLMYYTYGGHPAACAAANAVLEVMEREDLVARAAALEPVMAAALAPLKQHPNVAEVRGKGLLWAVELVRDRDRLERFPVETGLSFRIVQEGLARGVFFYPGGTRVHRDIVTLGPPFIVGEADIALIGQVLRDSIDAAVATA